MVSSHILPELADICNKIGIIDRGVMSVSAEVSEVMKRVREKTVLHIGVRGDQAQARKLIESNELIESVTDGDGYLVATLRDTDSDYSDLPKVLLDNGLGLTLFCEEEINLESAFMALTKGTGDSF